jgi:hypothetical protein
MVPEEIIEREGLMHVIPKRKKRRTRRITINYLRSKHNDAKWKVGRKPGVRQKRKMLAKFPLTPMGVLTPVSAQRDTPLSPPSTSAEIFRRTCLQSSLKKT